MLPNTFTLASNDYERLDNGLWINTTKTIEGSDYYTLSTKSTVKTGGKVPSRYVIRADFRKDLSTPEPGGALEDVLTSYIVINGSTRAFSQTDITDMIIQVRTFAEDADYLARVLRGEK